MSEQESNVFDRLGKLEGMLSVLLNGIGEWRSMITVSMARVERLEERQLALEREMVTRYDLAAVAKKMDDDMNALIAKVDALAVSDASRKGGTAVASWSVTNLAAWAAAIIALVALFGANVNRDMPSQKDLQQQKEQPR